MTSKEMPIKTVQELPDLVTLADIEERIWFLAVIDRGLADTKSGKIVPHNEVKESLKNRSSSKLDEMVKKALKDYHAGRTKEMGFDELWNHA